MNPPAGQSARDKQQRRSNDNLRLDGLSRTKRDGIIRGVRLETDWAQKPPVALWRTHRSRLVIVRRARQSALYTGSNAVMTRSSLL
jgi:hypothetical protein